MSRVLHCIASLAIGGVETMVTDMLDYFAQNGCRHEHVLGAFRGGELEGSRVKSLRAAGIRCEVVGRRSRFSPAFCRDLRRTVDRVAPDIIQAYNPTAALWTRLVVGRRSGAKIVVHCGSASGTGRKWRLIERALLSRSDAFIFSSHSTRAIWEDSLPINCPREVIYNGVNVSAQRDSDSLTELRPSPFTLLTVCRVAAVKSLATQIRAVKILHDRGQGDVRLMIVGDGPARAEVQDEVKRLGIGDAVSFEGFQRQPREYHRRAHVFLCTSYSEGLSVALAEAMVDGMVCISARVGGCSEIIEDGKSGFLIPCTEPLPNELKGVLPHGQTLPTTVYDFTTGELRSPLGVDPAALADKISDVRRRYDDLDAVGETARKRIIESFSMDQYCRSHEDFYTSLTSSSGR